MKPCILFVDDEPALLDGLRNAFRKEPYEILSATSAAEGLEMLSRHHVDVVVSDERMPGMSGSQFLAAVRQKYPDTIRMILTGQASLEAAVRAINEGEIYRFLSKPCSPVELAHTIRDALMLKDLKRESSKLLATTRKQRGVLDDLERSHPGITQREKTRDGAFVIDDEDEQDLDSLIREMQRENGRGGQGPGEKAA